ncbi:MAG: hypothetical protein ACLTER_22525 [Ruminococcus sp.]
MVLLEADCIWINFRLKTDVLYYEGTTLQSCMTVGCGSQYKIEGAGEIVTVFETEEEKRHAVCESRMEIPENTTVTCEKAIVYTSSQDMEVSELERFDEKELKEASEEWMEEGIPGSYG